MDKETLNGIPEEEIDETVEQAEEVTETVDDAADDTAEEETAAELEEEPAEDALQEEISSDETAEEEPQAEGENAEESDGGIGEESSEENSEDIVICSACGESEVAEGGNYCIECETKMLKRKIPLLAWLSGLWALGFSVFAVVLVALSSAPALQVIKGDICAKDKRWYAAYNEYSQVSAVADEINSILGMESDYTKIGMGVNKRIVDSIANYTSPIDAYYAAQNLIGAEHLDAPFMKEYSRIYQEHYDSYMAMGEILDKTFAEGADAEAIFAELDALRGTEGMTDLYIDFYKFAVAAELGVDANGQVELLKNLEKSCLATGDDYGWLYYQPLADTLCQAGRSEEAIEYLDKIIDADASKYDAYSLKTDILLKSGDVDAARSTVEDFKTKNEGMDSAYLLEVIFLRSTGEIEKASALCTEAMQEYENVPELGRQSALLSLLEGDYITAFNTMMNAYNNAYYMYYYTQDASTLDDPKFYGAVYLTAKLLSESDQMTEEIAEEVAGVLETFKEGTLPDNVEAIVNGEKTIEQVLTEGECDLA